MICSFTIYLKPLNLGERIKKYKNYDYLLESLKDKFTSEELKKIVISNFLTKDKYIEEKNYSIKISALDSKIIVKLFQFFFLKKMGEEKLKIDKTNFTILNIYNNNKYAKQLDEENEVNIYENRLRIKILTPMFFKIGNNFVTTTDINIILRNIEKKLKRSSILNKDNYSEIINCSKKITILEDGSREIKIDKELVGRVGEIVYDMSALTEEEILKINFLFEFAFFSGIGYMTEKGYGQIEMI